MESERFVGYVFRYCRSRKWEKVDVDRLLVQGSREEFAAAVFVHLHCGNALKSEMPYLHETEKFKSS